MTSSDMAGTITIERPTVRRRRLVAYVRVSTKEQADGQGPEMQRRECEVWCAQHGYELVGTYTDIGKSGASDLDSREAFPRLLTALNRGKADGMIMYRLDRLSRDMILQEMALRDLWARGYEVISCSDAENETLVEDEGDPARQMLRQILGAVAAYERQMIVVRMKQGRQQKARTGGYVGGQAPFGMRPDIDGGLVPDEAEQAVLAMMRDLHAAGESWGRIAKAVNAAGHRNRAGGLWQRQSIQRIVNRTTPV